MSVLGTGVAAGVAQTAATAQQVARQRDSERNEAARKAKRTRELFETHLQALDEGDESDSPAQVRIDGQLPDHPAPPPRDPSRTQHHQGDDQPVDGVDAAASPPPDSPLYRHLDIQA